MLQKEIFRTAGLVLISLLIGTFFSPILTCGGKNSSLTVNADPQKKASPAKSSAIDLQNAFQEVFDEVSPSVVSIATERTVNVNVHPFMNDPFFGKQFGGKSMKQKQNGLGSGIILNSEGFILTNHHVIKDMDKLTVKLKNHKSFEARLIGSDSTMDIALLKIDPKGEKLKPAVLGDSSKVKVGSWAIAVGSPLGFEQSFTLGVVSAVKRGGLDASGVSYIQTDAAINQGNSGGPLLNIYGEVIGINRMIVSPSGGSVGIGFSIPINEAKDIVDQLKTNGKVVRPWIGIGIDAISENDKTELKLKAREGALVKQIVEDSPADKAGLQIDVKTPEDIISYVRKSKVGKRLKLELIREEKKIRTSIVLEEKPN
ncbi:MAG: trypsin-like peptidase domain-containing protein [Leptospiraceae bacterium]|nr:trypsin-like peptidase domain-containing protein [Leptospiraceae bacterium]MCP5500349.1 trypsin-like peptidase domain-containing protein [Leptospiraceae bacterium]